MIKQFLPPVLTKVVVTLKRRRKYRIGQFKINIPLNHKLPEYQAAHKLYDQFLPVLASKIDDKGLVIDVGSNIGDTTIAMIQECENEFYCLEPSEYFYPFLEKNIKNLPTEYKNRVNCINKFIGSSQYKGSLDHSGGGTATRNQENSSESVVQTISMDELIPSGKSASLIKVDTDGFDFDVLLSGKETLKTSEPILYWENLMEKEYQEDGYNKLYDALKEIGYDHIYVFDNYGYLMLHDTDFDNLKKLNQYVNDLAKHSDHKTIYYTDVLAVTAKNKHVAEAAIQEYKKSKMEIS